MMFSKKESKQAAEKPVVCQEENRVIVCVWTSKRNRVVPGQDVRHVSIEMYWRKLKFTFLIPKTGIPSVAVRGGCRIA